MSNFLFIQNKCKLNFKIFHGQAINKTNANNMEITNAYLIFCYIFTF